MEKDNFKTTVIFRKFSDGDILAVFPEMPGDSSIGTCGSYQHIGQHGACSIFISDITKPATPREYADLKAELEMIGYNLAICLRFSKSHNEKRKAELERV